LTEEIKDQKPVEEIFQEGLDMLMDEIRETDKLYAEIKQHYDAVSKIRQGPALKFIADQAKTLVSLRSHKLSSIKDTISVRKTIEELKLKQKGLELRSGDEKSAIEELKEFAKIITSNIDRPEETVNPVTHGESSDEIDEITFEEAVEMRMKELKASMPNEDDEIEDEGIISQEAEKIEFEIVTDMDGNLYAIDPEGTIIEEEGLFSKFQVTFEGEGEDIKAFDPEGNEVEIIEF
jgi:hypothetical protein